MHRVGIVNMKHFIFNRSTPPVTYPASFYRGN